MVYRGKPSKGCFECRKRKIRCDQRKGGCENCSKANRQCSGYRNELDLMFADESANVISKLQAKAENAKGEAGKSSKSRSQTPQSLSSPSEVWSDGTALTPWRSEGSDSSLSSYFLSPSVEDVATNFFFSYHVIGMDEASMISSDFPMLASNYTDKNLITSIHAVGLASFASLSQSHDTIQKANSRYLEGVRLTNEALQNPLTAKKDSTLLAVMLLGFYETVSGQTINSLKDWYNHINGASSLLKLRGPEQLKTLSGLRMFVQAFTSQVIACMQQDKELPEHLLELREECSKYVDTTEISWRYTNVTVDFVKFHANHKRGMITGAFEVLSRALELDSRFEITFANVDPNATDGYYTVIAEEEDKDSVFGSYYHVYNDYLYAQTWNGMRCMRILLNEQIRNTIRQGWRANPPYFMDAEHVELHQQAINNLYYLQAEVLASVPQHMGFNKAQTPGSRSRVEVYDQSPFKFLWSNFAGQGGQPVRHDARALYPVAPNASTLPVIRMSGGYFLPWYLYLVGVMDISTPPVQEFVSNILQRIGHEMGVKQSLVLGHKVKEGIRINHINSNWDYQGAFDNLDLNHNEGDTTT